MKRSALAFAGIGIVVIMAISCGQKSTQTIVLETAEKAVLEGLVAHATAEFAEKTILDVENGHYLVSIAVGSQNKFGAMIRSKLLVLISVDSDGSGEPQYSDRAVLEIENASVVEMKEWAEANGWKGDLEIPEEKQLAALALSVENIQKLGQGVEQYIMDNPDIGSPKTSGSQELVELFIREGINFTSESTLDGWGNLLIYEPDLTPGSRSYTLESLGSDGKAEDVVVGEFEMTEFYRDIIWKDSRFFQRPKTR